MSLTPFNPQNLDEQAEQPTLSDLIDMALANAGRALRVSMPCAVVKIHGNQLVDLQPLFQSVYYAHDKPMDLPVLPLCPVCMPGGADFSIKYPLQVGDTGLAVFSDRALENWLSSDGQIVDPGEDRTHSLNDAVFFPGLFPTQKQTQDKTEDLVIRNGTAQVRLEKNGTFRIANQGQELVDLVGQLNQAVAKLVDTLQQAQVLTMMGPQPLWAKTQSDLASAGFMLAQLGDNLKTLRGE